jgi:hypothetical protein
MGMGMDMGMGMLGCQHEDGGAGAVRDVDVCALV